MSNPDNENRLIDLRIAIALVDKMERTGRLSSASARFLRTRLAEKYGVAKDSIFAVSA